MEMTARSLFDEFSVSRDIFDLVAEAEDDTHLSYLDLCGIDKLIAEVPSQPPKSNTQPPGGAKNPAWILDPLAGFSLKDALTASTKLSKRTDTEPVNGPMQVTSLINLFNKVVQEPTLHTKKTQAIDTAAALHRMCCNPSVTIDLVETILRRDPAAASRSATIKSTKSVYSPSSRSLAKRVVKESYTYPLNLAIKFGASREVIEYLIDASPAVLSLRDGPLQETPLAIWIKHRPQEVSTFDKMLLDCPDAAFIRDRYDNTLAHIATMKGASLEMLRYICILHPDSIHMRNFHGKTPVEISQQRTSSCSDAVAQFLWQKQAACMK